MNALALIDKYYPVENELKHILLVHSRSVAGKALQVADRHPELLLDRQFLEEASLLHDIGIFLTHAPGICCLGDKPYICHGSLGADLVRSPAMLWYANAIPEPDSRWSRSCASSCPFPIVTCSPSAWRSRSSALPINSSQRPIWTGRKA